MNLNNTTCKYKYKKYKAKYIKLKLKLNNVELNNVGGGQVQEMVQKAEEDSNIFEKINLTFMNKINEKFKLLSGTAIVSDVYNYTIQRAKDITDIKPGNYSLYYYNPHKSDGTNNSNKFKDTYSFYVALHEMCKIEDFNDFKWIYHDHFTTDVANGGIYDLRYYDFPNKIKHIEPGKNLPAHFDCKEYLMKWNDCRKYTITMMDVVVLPHGFYASLCGDGGHKVYIAKDDNDQVIGIILRFC